MLQTANISRKRRMIYSLFIAFIILSLLVVRIGYIQFIQGDELQTMAYKQQSIDRRINPKRGTIYDAPGKNVLAISGTVDTITVNSTNNTLRDLLPDLKDAVTAKNRDGDSVDGTVKWVDNNTSQKVRRTGDYRFKFIPDSSRYDEKQDWVTIKVK